MLIAVLLGPWAAVIAVSVALLIQALFFGDGGVLAFGANCFNMAFVMPFVGYGGVQAARPAVVADVAPTGGRRRASAATSGSTSPPCARPIEFGIQPDLFHTADGTPLYAPFHLAQTIPAMALAHLTVAGVVEFAFTAGVDRLPAARQPAGAAHQPSVDVPDARRATRAGRPARLAMGARSGWARWPCSRRSVCSRPGARSARTRPATSTCGSTT